MEGNVCHRVTDHVDCVNALCRLCGRRAKTVKDRARNRPDVLCADYANDILAIYNVCLLSDEDGKHSRVMCRKCLRTMTCLKYGEGPSPIRTRNAVTRIEAASGLWQRYDDKISANQCTTCAQFFRLSRGGRPLKAKDVLKKIFAANMNNSTQNANCTQTDKNRSEMLDVPFCPSDVSRSTPAKVSRLSEMHPSPTANVVSTAISPAIGNREVMCEKQQMGPLKDKKRSEMLDMPLYPSDVSRSTPTKVPRSSDIHPSPTAKFVSTAISLAIGNREVMCEEQQLGPLTDKNRSEMLDMPFCPSDVSTPTKVPRLSDIHPSPTANVVSTAISLAIGNREVKCEEQQVGPLTEAEERELTRLVLIKLNASADKLTVRCKTGGQPIILKRVTQP